MRKDKPKPDGSSELSRYLENNLIQRRLLKAEAIATNDIGRLMRTKRPPPFGI